ncbi:MAG: hypothetical protein U0822_25070 [Anaerolineae bacterium]
MSRVLTAALLALITLLAVACGPSGPTSVSKIEIARDESKGQPVEAGTTLAPKNNEIHAFVTLANPADGMKIRLVWVAVDAGDKKNAELDSSEAELSKWQDYVHGQMTLEQGWPPGQYRLDVYVNGQLSQSANFTVTADTGS